MEIIKGSKAHRNGAVYERNEDVQAAQDEARKKCTCDPSLPCDCWAEVVKNPRFHSEKKPY